MKTRIIALLVATAGFASAATITKYSSTTDVAATYINFDIDKFNSNLGTLTGVQVSVVQSFLVGSMSVTNNALNNATVSTFDVDFYAKGMNTNLGYSTNSNKIFDVVTTPDWNATTINPGNTQVFNFEADQNFIIAAQSIASDKWVNYSSAGGLGTVTFAAKRVPTISTSGGGYTVDPDAGFATTQFAITYTYTAVPEPSAALIGGLGLLCLLRRRR